MILGTVIQQPNEMLDYQIDFSGFLEDDDYIVKAEVFATGVDGLGFLDPNYPLYTTVPFIQPKEDMVIDDGSDDYMVIIGDPRPKNVKFFMYGGSNGDKLKVTIRIRTKYNRIKEEELKVKIKEI
jgi:hypothetical protein